MNPYVEVIVCLAAVPVVVAITIGAMTWKQSNKLLSLIRPFVVDGAFLGAFVAVPWAEAVPRQSWLWIPYFTGTAVALASSRWIRRKTVGTSNCLLALYFLAAASLLVPAVESLSARSGWIVGMALTIYMTFHCLTMMARQCQPALVGLCWTLICVSAGSVLLRSGNVQFAELSLALGAAVLGGAIVATLQSARNVMVYAAPTVSIALPALVVNGFVQQQHGVPLASWLLLLAAPIAIVLSQRIPVLAWRIRWRTAVQATGIAIVSAGAVFVAAST
jgi:hypothetical protein